MIRIVAILILASFVCVSRANAQETAKPIRLIAEAEDFTVDKGEWKVVPYKENYYASTFAITFLSRMACLGAPEQTKGDAIATQKIDVPSAGEFHVLARYEQPIDFSVEFTLEIEQAGKISYKKLFGKLEDLKIWALNGNKRVAMERYWWGGTDNIVWQQGEPVKLAKGPAILRLIAGPQLEGPKSRVAAARRNIDVICLTNDLDGMTAQKKTRYLEYDGWLVQDGDLFVRVTNPKDAVAPCIPVIEPLNGGQHSPYYIHIRDWPTIRVVKSGMLVDATTYHLTGPRSLAVAPSALAKPIDANKFVVPNPKNPKAKPTLTIPDEEYLQPGDTSAWVPVGQALDSLNDSTWHAKAVYKGKASAVYLQLEFGIPDGKGAVKSVRTVTVKDETFEMPGNVRANPVIRTQVEAVKWLRVEVEKFPKVGSVPKRLPIYGIGAFSGAMSNPGPLGEEATKLTLALGSNTLTGESAWAKQLGVPERKTRLVAHWPVGSEKTHWANALKAGNAKTIKVISFGDEIHISPLTPPKGKEDEFNAKFVAWLKSRNVPGADAAKFTRKDDDRWYYYSSLYSTNAGIEQYAAATKWLEENAGKDILTGANYSPHANFMVTEMQWVRPFKMRGMNMPWSEDYVWQIPEFSVQVSGYLTSGFRCGAKYHSMPIMMYVMPHSPGNTPRSFRLSYYTCIAHGATLINYFCASPLAVGGTENYVATHDLGMWQAVHKATHEAGVFEDYVVDGKVRPAKVGLLLSSVDEIMTGDSNSKGGIHNHERKAIYYALRHAQIPVDFVTEDDVIEGLCKDHKVIYVTQQYLHSNAVKALKKWVDAGGTLVALCGGGFTDEFGQANPDVNALFGVKSQSLYKDPKLTMVLAKQDLPMYKPLDTVEHFTNKIPVLVWKQSLTAGDGKVVGTYANGSSAVVEKAHGKGKAVLFGFFPGMAYERSGLPILPADRGGTDAGFNHFLPTAMDKGLRASITDAMLPKGYVRSVECSEPLVETTCIDSKGKLAVPLINYTGKSIDSLTVRIYGLTDAKRIRSVERGNLKTVVQDGATVVTLRLDVADMLLIDR